MSFGSSNKSGGQAARIWAADFAFKVRMWGRALVVSCLFYLLLLGYLVHENTWPIWREVTWKFQVAKLFRDFPIQPYFIIGGRRYRA